MRGRSVWEKLAARGGGRVDRFAVREPERMPTLMRFLIGLAVLGAIVAGGLVALATLVEPTPREMTIKVPQERFEGR